MSTNELISSKFVIRQYFSNFMPFNYSLDYKNLDLRQRPELYQMGIGEQGVLLVEPYKSEILPHWRFRTPEVAVQSSQKIYQMFLNYLDKDDFVGADMARKFLQMGFTRSRRYANHPDGRKYSQKPIDNQSRNTGEDKTQKLNTYPYDRGSRNKSNPLLAQADDWQTSAKAESARIFKQMLELAKSNPQYKLLIKEHKAKGTLNID